MPTNYLKKLGYKKYYRTMMRKLRPSRLQTLQKMTGVRPKYGRSRLERRINNIESRLSTEVLFFDNNVAPTAVDNAGAYQVIFNAISQGDGENDRTAEKVKGKNLVLNYTAKINASATNTTLAMAIVYDKKPAIGATSWTTVYQNAVPQSQFLKDNGDRYVVLKHMVLSLNNAGKNAVSGKIFINLKDIASEWSSSTNTAFTKGRLSLVAISDEATNTPTLTVYSRYNFYDN